MDSPLQGRSRAAITARRQADEERGKEVEGALGPMHRVGFGAYVNKKAGPRRFSRAIGRAMGIARKRRPFVSDRVEEEGEADAR